jgi:hypothetical protein
MSLKNLADIGQLKPHSASREEIARLLQSAADALTDAKRKDLHAISRFDLAYKSAMQSALAALMANGYRPSTSQPGHQQTTIRCVCTTPFDGREISPITKAILRKTRWCENASKRRNACSRKCGRG